MFGVGVMVYEGEGMLGVAMRGCDGSQVKLGQPMSDGTTDR